MCLSNNCVFLLIFCFIFSFFRRALLVNRFLLLLNFLVLCFFFVTAYKVWRRIEFPRLLCSRFYAAIFNYLLFFYLPFDPFFVGLMADSASLVSISFLSFSIFILFVEWLMLSLFFHCLALFLFFFFFALSLSTVHCIACRAHC